MTNLVENKISFSSLKDNLCDFFNGNAKTPLVDAMQVYKKGTPVDALNLG